jgi:hypothetical protein
MEGFAFVAHPPLPCRASPPQGGRLAGRTLPASSAALRFRASDRRESISPLEGEMPGRAEGGEPRAHRIGGSTTP